MTTVIVTFTQAGIHHWPSARGRGGNLSSPHRHLFHFRCEVEVRHLSREIELHDLATTAKSWLNMQFGRLDNHTLDLEDHSCEFLAELMAGWLTSTYPDRWVAAECWEDGEMGARYEKAPARVKSA
jgi:hypothetical protein